MHWVIQKSIFKAINYQVLTESLAHQNISYTEVSIPSKTLELNPDILELRNVYVCGAINLIDDMKQLTYCYIKDCANLHC